MHFGSADNLMSHSQQDQNSDKEEGDGAIFTSILDNLDQAGLPEFNIMNESHDMNRGGMPSFGGMDQSNFGSPYMNNNDVNSPELAALFAQISNFQPNELEITPHFKPFLPELVPSIGAIDAFIKIPRPDAQLDDLGLVVLDEPSIGQMDPQIFKMELREKFGVVSPGSQGDAYIGSLKATDMQNSKALNSFLSSIEEIHRNRPPPSMTYSTKMPEFEELMEVWPDEIEEMLKTVPIPGADMDLSVEEYVRVICAILEIPVKGNMVESLYHLFSLFAQFEGNTYFQSQDNAKQ
ncbi:hypothetical protein TRFO_33081 [Tritrichomonas foetus]|uniref:Intraflagellar transport protein 46 like protein n=1 Tax=Tritrichomonas foetus TaxID=1144522 RepID=A0A1J4JNH3_9EUKA|nr:hypothetical protein TRFO_33081 [Tritrichomonas foetus]|eukprot:OHT00258.1 hypothetical protein TRFO_33081 [Tritrichomonas foetus]